MVAATQHAHGGAGPSNVMAMESEMGNMQMHHHHHGGHHSMTMMAGAADASSSSSGATFHFSTDCGPLLFDWWHPQSLLGYVVSLVAIFGVGVAAEWLASKSRTRVPAPPGAVMRYMAVDEATQASSQPLCLDGEVTLRSSSKESRLPMTVRLPRGKLLACSWDVAFHALAIALHYALMLLAMTFNVGIFAAVVLGLAVGRQRVLLTPGPEAVGGRTPVELCH